MGVLVGLPCAIIRDVQAEHPTMYMSVPSPDTTCLGREYIGPNLPSTLERYMRRVRGRPEPCGDGEGPTLAMEGDSGGIF